MFRFFRASLLLALIMLLLAAVPWAQAAKIKFGHVAPPFHGQSKGVDAFAAYVKDKTGGRIEVATFPMGQLGGERSMAEQVQAGTLEICSVTTAMLGNFVPEMFLFDLPFVYPDRRTAYAFLDDPEVQNKFFSFLPKKGFVGIGWTENEFRDFTNTKRPVRKPEDVKGLKVRVIESPIYLETFKQLGASPVGIPFPELYSALQQGVIDAQENPIMTSVLMKFTEVTKHATRTHHSLTECAVLVNPDYWASLGPADQKIFREAAQVGLKVNREVNADLEKKLPKINLSVEEYCKKAGVELIELTPREREAFRAAMVPVWDKYKAKVGAELFDFFLDKIKSHQK